MYGNLWIAACALALAFQTQFVLTGAFRFSPVAAFVFFGTLSLYGLHRIIGLNKVQAFKNKGRFAVISRFTSHILFYAGVSAVAAAWYWFKIPVRIWPWLLFPGLLGGGYVIPIFKGKRLRDFNDIKIFLIAVVWTAFTVLAPAVELHRHLEAGIWLMALERFLFIFAITLPFDLRDLPVDTLTGVRTLPRLLGRRRTVWVSAGCLILAFSLAAVNFGRGLYAGDVLIGTGVTTVVTIGLVAGSRPERHDYYYSGLMDGMMIFQFLAVWITTLMI
ncbi:MAG: hypothetical protein H6562_06410 [Lewinellaceae bacterium]|nr:hypothetical protein [Lewinella sp.]MCB9278527.1 hypothetical protein [Lewinellaceae bacterium]